MLHAEGLSVGGDFLPDVARAAAHGSLPTAYCSLPTAYCSLPTAYCLLPTVFHCPVGLFTGVSVEMPHAVVVVVPLDEFLMYHVAFDCRHTA